MANLLWEGVVKMKCQLDNFETNNKNLEISLGCESNIPYAFLYDTDGLPRSIKERYGYE